MAMPCNKIVDRRSYMNYWCHFSAPSYSQGKMDSSNGNRVSREMDTGEPVAPAAPMILKRQIVDSNEEQDSNDKYRRAHVLREMEDIMRYARKLTHNREEESEELDGVKRSERPGFFNMFKNMIQDDLDFGKRKISISTQCKKPYPQSSTMCAYQDDPSVKVKGVSDQDIKTILAEHNNYRSNVKPPAKAMQKLYWCPELEAIAQKWAQVCSGSFHDQNDQRKVPDWGITVGQNAAYGQKDWKQVVAAWHSEVKDFTYGKSYGSDWGKIGHYTQVVRDIATCIGCGYALCGKGPNYICNYAFGNPFLDKIGYPYEKGSSCSDCSGKCQNKLCDCGGIVCKNGGTLDPKTCTCSCKGKLWTGKDCSKKNKSACKDPGYCSKPQPQGFLGKCKVWTNVPEECPKMCGVC